MKPADLNHRTTALVERLRDRLTDSDYKWAFENAINAEWELAIATLRGLMSRGRLAMTEAELDELTAIEALVDRRLLGDLLITDWSTRQDDR